MEEDEEQREVTHCVSGDRDVWELVYLCYSCGSILVYTFI